MGINDDIFALELKAIEIKKSILDMLYEAQSGHTGGSMSCADILTYLFYYRMKHDPENPKWEDRDIFVLSKGHAAPALYSVLGNTGYFPKEEFKKLRKLNALLQGHPSMTIPGVENPSGSLGQGLSIANGIALAKHIDKKSSLVYVLLGDGELQEGQVWEAAMTASHYKIKNLCAIVDNNEMQIDGRVEEVKNIYPINSKFESFGWNAICFVLHEKEKPINYKGLIDTFNKFDEYKKNTEKPTVIIARTVKAFGVHQLEGRVESHGVAPNKKQYEETIKTLTERENEVKKYALEDYPYPSMEYKGKTEKKV